MYKSDVIFLARLKLYEGLNTDHAYSSENLVPYDFDYNLVFYSDDSAVGSKMGVINQIILNDGNKIFTPGYAGASIEEDYTYNLLNPNKPLLMFNTALLTTRENISFVFKENMRYAHKLFQAFQKNAFIRQPYANLGSKLDSIQRLYITQAESEPLTKDELTNLASFAGDCLITMWMVAEAVLRESNQEELRLSAPNKEEVLKVAKEIKSEYLSNFFQEKNDSSLYSQRFVPPSKLSTFISDKYDFCCNKFYYVQNRVRKGVAEVFEAMRFKFLFVDLLFLGLIAIIASPILLLTNLLGLAIKLFFGFLIIIKELIDKLYFVFIK